MTKKRNGMEALVEILNRLGQYRMRAVFTTILALAQSKRHLRDIHDRVLPPNCRLLRSDVEELLEPAWEQVHPGGATQAQHTNDVTTKLLIDATRALERGSKATLKRYYLDALDAGRKEVGHAVEKNPSHWVHFNNVYSEPEAGGHGYEHFIAFVCGHRFDLAVQLTPDKTQMVVRLVAWESQLTELLTHRLLTELPPSMIGYRMGAISDDPLRSGSEVDFCWLTPAKGLVEHLRVHQYENSHREALLIGDSTEFVAALMKRLTKIGVTLDQDIQLVTYKEEDTN